MKVESNRERYLKLTSSLHRHLHAHIHTSTCIQRHYMHTCVHTHTHTIERMWWCQQYLRFTTFTAIIIIFSNCFFFCKPDEELTEDSLWCLFIRGFSEIPTLRMTFSQKWRKETVGKFCEDEVRCFSFQQVCLPSSQFMWVRLIYNLFRYCTNCVQTTLDAHLIN